MAQFSYGVIAMILTACLWLFYRRLDRGEYE
jgi:hypothetical protein